MQLVWIVIAFHYVILMALVFDFSFLVICVDAQIIFLLLDKDAIFFNAFQITEPRYKECPLSTSFCLLSLCH